MNEKKLPYQKKKLDSTTLQEQSGKSIIIKRGFDNWTLISGIYNCAFTNSIWPQYWSQMEVQWREFSQSHTQPVGGQTLIQIQAHLTPKSKHFPVELASKN